MRVTQAKSVYNLVAKGSWFAVAKEHYVFLVEWKLTRLGVCLHLTEARNVHYPIVEKGEDGEAICILGELFQENSPQEAG